MIVLKIDSWMRERLEVASQEMPCARFGAIPIQGVLTKHINAKVGNRKEKGYF